jgi:hypothetical protein
MQGPDTDAQDQPPPFFHIRLATHGRSIQMGQSRHFDDVPVTSAFPPIATKERTSRDVSNVPGADIVEATASDSPGDRLLK